MKADLDPEDSEEFDLRFHLEIADCGLQIADSEILNLQSPFARALVVSSQVSRLP